MKSKPNLAFTNRVQRHVKAFIAEHDLIGDKEIIVAVSGGVDSMVLMTILKRCGYSFGVVSINHSTRISQIKERDLVNEYTRLLGLSCANFKLKNLAQSNFEHNARIERYKIFNYMSEDKKLIALGHHIDDSFEWSLMQQFKSGNLESSIGIPLKNKNIIRPLMCLTKRQILRYAKELDIPFMEDPTNTNTHFERNYIRHEIIPKIRRRNPNYLIHYVNRQNELAQRLNLHCLKKTNYQLKLSNGSALIYRLDTKQALGGFEHLIVKAMKELNPNSRGSLGLQIKKIKQAMSNHKMGPLILTRGIKAYISFNCILLTKKESSSSKFKTRSYKRISFDEYSKIINSKICDINSFPHWVILESGARIKGFVFNKRISSYNEEYSTKLCDNGLSHIAAIKLLSQWSKPKNRNKRLDLIF